MLNLKELKLCGNPEIAQCQALHYGKKWPHYDASVILLRSIWLTHPNIFIGERMRKSDRIVRWKNKWAGIVKHVPVEPYVQFSIQHITLIEYKQSLAKYLFIP